MSRANIKSDLIDWACNRSCAKLDVLEKRFPKLPQWLSGDLQPTMNQLESFSKATLTPLGYFFLSTPPVESLPVPDFRTVKGRAVARPSAALLETIYSMQRRQDWLREYLEEEGEDSLTIVGSVTLETLPTVAARAIREALGVLDGWADEHVTWESALIGLRRAAEASGIVVVINGVVGNNTHAPLNVQEFRGFVLSDKLAPLIFINGADAKSAQMFTLAHEIAHVWLGRDGVFDLPDLEASGDKVEMFCNQVAAEVLIPSVELQQKWALVSSRHQPFQALARMFKVSPIVAARRAFDLQLVTREVFFEFIKGYRAYELSRPKSSGGDFYRTQETRIGRRFGLAVTRAAKAGRLLYRDAYQLTGLAGKTFDLYAEGLRMT
jgi:Zn-dependent peptidase ImmA (M78 family)